MFITLKSKLIHYLIPLHQIGKYNCFGKKFLSNPVNLTLWSICRATHCLYRTSCNSAAAKTSQQRQTLRKEKLLHFIGYPNFINDLTQLVQLQTLAHVQLRVKLSKSIRSNIAKQLTKGKDKTYFDLLKL